MCNCMKDMIREAKRLGRARYVCPHCGEDVSLTLFLIMEAEFEHEKIRNNICKLKKKKKAVR